MIAKNESAASAHQPDFRSVGARVRRLRLEKEWSQTQLAEQLGCTLGEVCAIENGHGLKTIHMLIALCDAFSVSPNCLLYETEELSKIILRCILQNELSRHTDDELRLLSEVCQHERRRRSFSDAQRAAF